MIFFVLHFLQHFKIKARFTDKNFTFKMLAIVLKWNKEILERNSSVMLQAHFVCLIKMHYNLFQGYYLSAKIQIVCTYCKTIRFPWSEIFFEKATIVDKCSFFSGRILTFTIQFIKTSFVCDLSAGCFSCPRAVFKF